MSPDLLRLTDNVASSLQNILDAHEKEDIDWPGAQHDLAAYWAARYHHETQPELPLDQPIPGHTIEDIPTGGCL